MENIGVKELRDNLSRILKRVEQGEVIRVIRHGKDIVELRPIEKNIKQDFLNRLKDKDISRGGAGKMCPVKSVKNLRPDMPVSDLVVEDRR
ncbi:MAG: type II toxin-antitoxin system prevent-host-death family antitoxin [Thermodesulfobacteriota bacterium]|nr:type II toxin-antitoxin system prevent-host-death family antitoxin [Thermodesulfobacteriota bacterium]